jgi:hypothetical protein
MLRTGPVDTVHPAPWYQVWLKAITSPNVATYQIWSPPRRHWEGCCGWAWSASCRDRHQRGIVLGFSSLSLLDPVKQEESMFSAPWAPPSHCVPRAVRRSRHPGLLLSADSHLLVEPWVHRHIRAACLCDRSLFAPGSIVSSSPSYRVGAVVDRTLLLLFLNVLAIKAFTTSAGAAVISSVLFLVIVRRWWPAVSLFSWP